MSARRAGLTVAMQRVVMTTHLEMTDRAELRPAPDGAVPLALVRAEIPCPELNRFLYASVGARWWWYRRLRWDHAEWLAYLDRPELETWIAYVAGTPAGYFELESQDGGSVELVYFGLMPGFVGRGLGGALLTAAVRRAWDMGARRVWVHTCALGRALYAALGLAPIAPYRHDPVAGAIVLERALLYFAASRQGISRRRTWSMKAIRVHTPGGPDVMKLEDVADPQAKAGEAVVKVDAAGLNYIDVYYRTGTYKAESPFTPGMEAGGTVTAVGPNVSEVKVGDKVAYTGVQGSYAQYAVVPSAKLVVLPSGVTTRQGAATMLQGMTAHYLACSTYPLKPGDTCLVHAAAGGVGLLLTQIAKMRGAKVLGTVSTEDKAKLAREAGADDVINYASQDFEAEVKRITGGKLCQVVYDAVGKTTFDKSLNCLAPRGLMALYGAASGPVGPFDLGVLNAKGSIFITRPSLFAYTATRDELLQRAGETLGWVRDGKLKLRTEFEFALKDAAESHRALEGRKTTGKVLLIP